MKGISRIRPIGGSLIVTIPPKVVKAEGIGEGQEVEIDVRRKRKNWFGVMKGIGKFSEEDRMEDRG